MTDLVQYLQNQSVSMQNLLTELVVIESPTTDKQGVDAVGTAIARHLSELGADVTRYPQEGTGDHILSEWNSGSGDAICLLLHMDTVHPIGSLAARPIRVEDDKFYGPGCCDMKASHVIAIYAMEALQELPGGVQREVRMLFTSDEETGSHTSRALIEEVCHNAALVMVMEPALPDGRLKSSRKGVGEFVVTAHGRSAHAGGAHRGGINAIEELAHQVLCLQAMTDYERGITLSVGDIRGGGVVNVVPDTAVLQVDARVKMRDDADFITDSIFNLAPVLPGASLTVSGSFNRPPMECDAMRLALISQIQDISAPMGIAIDHGASGGGSDASFTAELGIPTMDGFGAVGDGLHATDEHVILASLPERAALTAAIIRSYKRV